MSETPQVLGSTCSANPRSRSRTPPALGSLRIVGATSAAATAANAASVLVTDRTALLGSSAAALAGLPVPIIACYITARLLLPVLLIVYAAHTATPTQRIALVRDHLLGHPNPAPGRGTPPSTSKRRTRRKTR